MRLGFLGGLIVSWVAVPAAAQERCEPTACLASVSASVAVTLADAPPSDIAGLWKNGGGLGGQNLYLFADRSYVYTQWGDIQPETIYDMGEWRFDEGVLRLSADDRVAWAPDSDRRFAALRATSARGKTLLFGLDRSLECFLDLVREHPDTTPGEWIEVSAFTRQGDITERETSALKRRLYENSWRPGYFQETEDIRASERQLDDLRPIIDRADRVEALPVTMDGEGRRSRARVVEKPVPVDAKTARSLADLLTAFDWWGGSPMPCMFTPHAAFRFHRGDRSAQVLICFQCGEMVLDGLDGALGGKKLLGNGRRTWLRAAKRAFPNDPALQREK